MVVLHNHQQPFKSKPKTDRGDRWTAKLLDEVIIPSAAANSTLRTYAVGYYFKNGARIVIKAANDISIDNIVNVCGIKAALKPLKMRPAVVAEIIYRTGCALADLLAAFLLAVNDPHGISFKSGLTCCTHVVYMFTQILI